MNVLCVACRARGHTARCVLATDGMWNQVSDARVRAILSRGGAARPGSDGGALASARSLANEAHRAHVATGQAASRTFDDITVMVVDVSTHPLNGSEPGSPDRQGSVRAAEPSGEETAIGKGTWSTTWIKDNSYTCDRRFPGNIAHPTRSRIG